MSDSFLDINTSLKEFASLLNKDEFDEEPEDLRTFVTNRHFLGLPELSPIQYEIVERMSQIYLPHTLINLYGQEEGQRRWDNTVNEVICEIGKGGGKDFSIRIAFARIIYLLHCLRDPLEYYNKGRGEYIDLLNIAINDSQAKEVFFEPFKNLIHQSPYFQGQDFYAQSHKITFHNKNIRALSGHSGAEGWEGYNLIATVLDEIAAFKTEDELGGMKNRYSAKVIYDMAKNSVISRFPSVGKVALLSFPRYKNDFIEQRYDAAISEYDRKIIKHTFVDSGLTIQWEEDEIKKYQEKRVWAIKLPTFKVNPTKTPEDFEVAFLNDPIESRSRFLCMPPLAQQAYFRDGLRVRKCFPDIDKLPETKIYPYDEEGQLVDNFRDPDGPIRWIHIDLGLNRDRAALCMVHCKGYKTVQTLEGDQNMPVIEMDLIDYWEAEIEHEIDFTAIRQLALDLSTRFNVAQISLDRWNSEDTKKIFMSKGIYTVYEVVDKKHYDTLSSSIYDGRLMAYYHPILVDGELLRLMLINGNKVDHPKKGFKDGSDCLAGATYFCTVNSQPEEEIDIVFDTGEYEEQLEELRREEKKPEPPTPLEMPQDISEFLKGMQIL